MSNAEEVTVQLGELKVTAPVHAIVREMLTRMASAPTPSAAPTIGKAWEGGIYAGLTLQDNRPAHLILLPGDEKKNWGDAKEWARAQGGELPSRIDALMLFKHLKSDFQDVWYWTGEELASYPVSAWLQTFSHGYQYYVLKANGYRARAVRRLVIE